MDTRSSTHSTRDLTRLLPVVGDPVSSFWRRLCRGTRLLRRAADWDRFAGVGWEERIMSEPVTDRLHCKQGRSIGRRLFSDGKVQLSVYLKRHYRLSWWKGFLATLLPHRPWSPGLEEWQHLVWATEQGFNVPRPVAAGQLVGPWCRLQGFLAVEELKGMLPLHEAVPLAEKRLDPNCFLKWKHGLIMELARVTRELHSRKVFHKDLYLCHFYISEQNTNQLIVDWTNKIVIIDLHRLARHPITGVWWQAKDLAQLLYSSEIAGVTFRDRIRFWKHYQKNWVGRRPSEWLLKLMRWKFWFYQRHERRRRR